MQHHSIQPTSLGISYGDSAHPSSSQTTTIQDYTHLDPEALNDPSVSKSYEETTEQDEELDEERRIVGQRDEFIRSAAPTPQLPGSHSAFQSIKGGPGVGFLLSGDGGQQQDSEAMSSTAEAQMKEEKEDMSSSLQVSQESLEESAEPMMDFLGHSVKALDALASQTKQKLSAIAQEEERVYRITDEANRKMFELKLQEIKFEEDLVRTGTHPDYIGKLQEIEYKKDSTLSFSRDHLKCAIENEEAYCDGEIKFADDTFWERKKIIRKRIMEHVHSLRNQLRIEYGKLNTSNGLPVPALFNSSAVAIGKRKRLQADQLSLGPGFTAEIPMPDWIRHVLKIRRRVGLDPIPVPSPCLGLDDHEIEQDLSFFHTLREALSERKDDETVAEDSHASGSLPALQV